MLRTRLFLEDTVPWSHTQATRNCESWNALERTALLGCQSQRN